VWVELPVADNYNLLIGLHYFTPDFDVKIIKNCLNILEKNLNTHHYRVIMLEDLNVPMCDWLNGIALSNCYYYNKIKGNLIHAAPCFLGLNQHNNSVPNSTLLDVVFTNINDLCVSISDYPMVAPVSSPTQS
jgi:hypothetical protein